MPITKSNLRRSGLVATLRRKSATEMDKFEVALAKVNDALGTRRRKPFTIGPMITRCATDSVVQIRAAIVYAHTDRLPAIEEEMLESYFLIKSKRKSSFSNGLELELELREHDFGSL
jgi:hypothetical protein